MKANKIDYFNELSNYISDPIYLTDRTDEVRQEIEYNCWYLGATFDIIAQATITDFLEFIQKVKESYKNQLNNSQFDIDLIFYLWFDEMTGQLCFNFINSNHDKLPFACKLKHTDKQEEIIDKFRNSKYLEGIPHDELEEIDTPEKMAEIECIEKMLKDNFVLTVYQEKIKKQR
jgi:hypothetical protein